MCNSLPCVLSLARHASSIPVPLQPDSVDSFAQRITSYKKAFCAFELFRQWYCSDLKRRGQSVPLAQSRRMAQAEWESLPQARIAEFERYAALTKISADLNRNRARANESDTVVGDRAQPSSEKAIVKSTPILQCKPCCQVLLERCDPSQLCQISALPDTRYCASLETDEQLSTLTGRVKRALPLSTAMYKHYMADRQLKTEADNFERQSADVASHSKHVPEKVRYPTRCGALCATAMPAACSAQKVIFSDVCIAIPTKVVCSSYRIAYSRNVIPSPDCICCVMFHTLGDELNS